MTDKKVSMQGTVKMVSTAKLFPDPKQPRQDFDEGDMEKLKDSIKDRGIMNPITVEPEKGGKYLIIDGERRFRNALDLGIKSVPVNILATAMSEFERNIIRFQLQETHKQWTPFEKAEAMANLKTNLGISTLQLARALAVAPVTCNRYLSLLLFPIGYRKIFIKAKLPMSLIIDLSYVMNNMPEKLKQQVPKFIDNTIEKYQKGYLKATHDLRIISKVMKMRQYKYAVKFFNQLNYTATNASVDSGLVVDYFSQAVLRQARALDEKLNIMEANKIKVSAEQKAVFDGLVAKINKL